MKKLPICMLTSICGPDFDLQPKQETDRFSIAEAIRLIESGQAVPVSQADYETATRKPAESRAGQPATAKAPGKVAKAVGAVAKRIRGK